MNEKRYNVWVLFEESHGDMKSAINIVNKIQSIKSESKLNGRTQKHDDRRHKRAVHKKSMRWKN